MGFRVEMPTGEERARQLLSKFMEYATQKKYIKEFGKAVEIIYGPCYHVKVDLSNRMCFTCEVCRKDMNNVKSLHEHSNSGQHIKNHDSVTQEKLQMLYRPNCKSQGSHSKVSNHSHTLFIEKIRHSSEVIIGLHYIEAYDDCKGRIYYKCNLCGAHGKGDSMYNHLIGEKHTDKYISIKVNLDKIVYGSNFRKEARQRIAKTENPGIDSIAIIRGKRLYPYKWEFGGSRAKHNTQRKEFDFSMLKKQTSGDENPTIKTDSLVSSPTQEQNFMSYWYFEKILLKFNAIVQLHLDEASDLHSPNDLKFCLLLHIYILHHLFFVVRSLKNNCRNNEELQKFYEAQDSHLKKALGCLRFKISEEYTVRYSKTFGALPLIFKDK